METTSKKIEISVEDRYYLVGETGWIFSSNDIYEVENFKNNMKNSGRFYKKDIEKLIVIDILSLGEKD